MIDLTRPITHFLNFSATLRRAGFAVAPEQTIAWLAAIDILGPDEIGDIHRAARAMLAPPPERFAEFDAIFDAHFRGAPTPTSDSPPGEEAPLQAADDRGGGPEPLFGDETRESGASATRAERLSTRRFLAATEGDTLRRFTRAFPARAPKRRGYRWRPAHGGPGTDARRMFRDAMRNAGEFVRLRRRRRSVRQRRIVVLIDISGSMKERTQAHLSFAHALVHAAATVEVFTFGTRLTRITRALRHRNRVQALAIATLLVADWDGGTRIGEALNAFLAIPRFSALARGAALVVLSDGLERGNPTAMVAAVARFSRITWRTVWLTPLAIDPSFEPKTAGLKAASPYLDELGDGGSLASICEHVLELVNARAV
jgi:uncharacterized protein with von Willebrand factor type A (vWA) domain